MLFVIAGIALAVLGVLAYIISQMPDPPTFKKKKEKKLPPPEPPKDWPAIVERRMRERTLHRAGLTVGASLVVDLRS